MWILYIVAVRKKKERRLGWYRAKVAVNAFFFSGSVPFAFGNFSELVVLDLSQNAYLMSEILAFCFLRKFIL